MPEKQLRQILENRVEWRAYGRAWEIQRLGHTLDGVAEVTSGEQ